MSHLKEINETKTSARKIVIDSWNHVQKNIVNFKDFGTKNFVIVDNNRWVMMFLI